MADAPLMPKATAVWLADNTSLTFEQIADFCAMHPLEVKGIADEDVAKGIKGIDPIANGQLSREQIEAGEADPNVQLKLAAPKYKLPHARPKRAPRYTPVSRRHERPSAILWLVRNHPELKDSQIMRLVGTTKTTIASVRDRTHWNASTLTPMDPVTLGLCSQIELDFEVQRAAKEKPAAQQYGGATLLPASETTRKDAAGAILYAAEKATWMAGEAIQALGGNGYINDYPTGRLWRDAKLYEIGAGTSEIRRMLIGRELFNETK